MDYVAIAERADGVTHDVAQTHLPEFVGDVELYPEADVRA